MTDITGKTLLIVEDEPDLREVLCMQFEQMGFEIKEAGNGLEAIEVFKQGGVDGILSDIRMPKMDGVKLLDAIRNDFKSNIGLVFVTGFSDITEPKAYARGADGFVKKPYDRANLGNVVHAIFCTKKERWRRETGGDLLHDYSEKLGEMDERGGNAKIALGRGGFMIELSPSEVPSVGEGVSFDFTFKKGPIRSLKGEGVVRWGRADTKNEWRNGAGIEIFKLSEESLEPAVSFIERLNPIAFIPENI